MNVNNPYASPEFRQQESSDSARRFRPQLVPGALLMCLGLLGCAAGSLFLVGITVVPNECIVGALCAGFLLTTTGVVGICAAILWLRGRWRCAVVVSAVFVLLWMSSAMVVSRVVAGMD